MLRVTVADAQSWYAHAAALPRSGRFAGARVEAPRRQPHGALVTFLHDPAGVLLHPDPAPRHLIGRAHRGARPDGASPVHGTSRRDVIG